MSGAPLLQSVNSEAIEALMLAAETAEKEKTPNAREIYEPYRSTIQTCMDKGLSVQKIYDILKAHGVGEKFAPASFQKYINQGKFKRARGKFAGLTPDEIEAKKKQEAAHQSPGPLFASTQKPSVASLLSTKAPEPENKPSDRSVVPRPATGPL